MLNPEERDNKEIQGEPKYHMNKPEMHKFGSVLL